MNKLLLKAKHDKSLQELFFKLIDDSAIESLNDALVERDYDLLELTDKDIDSLLDHFRKN